MNSWSWRRGVWSPGELRTGGLSESNWNRPDWPRNKWPVRTNSWFRDNPAFEMHPLSGGFVPTRIG
jgi:hypothetical protein